jgi:hypothetical protein
MKKRIEQQPGSALVPVTSSLPAVAPVNISDVERDRLVESFREELKRDFKTHGGEMNFSRSMIGGLGSVLGGATALVPVMGLVFAVPVGVPIALLLGMSIQHEKKFARNLNLKKKTWAEGKLKRSFENAQREAYGSQKCLVVAAAERNLGAGRVLSLEDAAWIANLSRQDIKQATDQLAITVYQIRKLLAHARCASFNSDGSKSVSRPLAFADLRLDPNFPPHRAYLRERLAAADEHIEEDNYPYIKVSELEGMSSVKTGFWNAVKNYAAPWEAAKRRRQQMEIELPRYKDVEAHVIFPVADFAEALETYEATNPPLDLPALRGWKGGVRKALPGPGRFL